MIATAKAKPKPFDVILVHKFDRFARSREDSVVYKSLLKKEAGVKVISITEYIEDDKFSVILEAMLEAMAEYYSLNLADEVKKGMTEKAERGGYQTTPPFGYKMENKKLVIVEEEAKFIRLIFEKYSSREMGMRALAIYINDLGVRTKRGNLFDSRGIEYIINNPVYLGKARWTPTGRVRRNYNNPDSIIADSDHEPIITQELWDMAQIVHKENKELFQYRAKDTTIRVTWLQGLIYCSSCGKSFVRSSGKYFQCNGYSKGQCKASGSIQYKVLENLVLEEIKNTFTSPINLHIVPKPSDTKNKNEFNLIEQQLETFGTKFIRIKTAYQDGIDSLEEYKDNKTHLETERENLINKLKDLKTALMNIGDEKPIDKRIEDVYNLLTDETIDLEIKYNASHFLINKIIFDKSSKTLNLQYKY